MSGLELVLRGCLAVEAFLALLLSGAFFGTIWPERGWPTRVVCAGLFGVLVYVFAGQIKAFNLSIPFDGFSAVGLLAYTVLLTGFVWFVLRERRTRRGR